MILQDSVCGEALPLVTVPTSRVAPDRQEKGSQPDLSARPASAAQSQPLKVPAFLENMNVTSFGATYERYQRSHFLELAHLQSQNTTFVGLKHN